VQGKVDFSSKSLVKEKGYNILVWRRVLAEGRGKKKLSQPEGDEKRIGRGLTLRPQGNEKKCVIWENFDETGIDFLRFRSSEWRRGEKTTPYFSVHQDSTVEGHEEKKNTKEERRYNLRSHSRL